MSGALLSQQEIFSYLQSRGFKLSSENILKEVEAHGLWFWTTLASLARSIQSHQISNTVALLSHELEEPDRHAKSTEWVCAKLYLSNLLGLLGVPFKIMNFFRPDRESMHVLLSRVIQVCQWCDRQRLEFESSIASALLVQRELERASAALHLASEEHLFLQQRKAEEEPLYRELSGEVEALKQQTQQQRSERLELLRRDNDLKEACKGRAKSAEQSKFEACQAQYEIVHLEREIARSAPEVKRDLMHEEEQLRALHEERKRESAAAQARDRRLQEKKEEWHRYLQNYLRSRQLLPLLATCQRRQEEAAGRQRRIQEMEENLGEEHKAIDGLMKECQAQAAGQHQVQYRANQQRAKESALETHLGRLESSQAGLKTHCAKNEQAQSELARRLDKYRKVINDLVEKTQGKLLEVEAEIHSMHSATAEALEGVYPAKDEAQGH